MGSSKDWKAMRPSPSKELRLVSISVRVQAPSLMRRRRTRIIISCSELAASYVYEVCRKKMDGRHATDRVK